MKTKSFLSRTMMFVILFSIMLVTISCGLIPNPVLVPGSGPAQGHWEGDSPSVSFDMMADGQIRNFQLVGSLPMGTCTITIDELKLDPSFKFEFGKTDKSSNHVMGSLTNAKTFEGTYKIATCRGAGDQVSVVLNPEDKNWKAEWKGDVNTTTTATPSIVTEDWTATPSIVTEDWTATPSIADMPPVTQTQPAPAAQVTVSPGSWQRIGTLPSQVNSYAIYPTDSKILYAATGKNGSGSGLYKSEDGGLTWKISTTGLPQDDIWGLAFSGNTLLAVAQKSASGHVFASSDGANSWSVIGDSRIAATFSWRLWVAPGDGRTVFIQGYARGISRSRDGGSNWMPIMKGLPMDSNDELAVQCLAFDPIDGNIMYAGTGAFVGGGHGVYKSIDGGATWSASNDNMLDNRITAIATVPTRPQTIYAGSDAGEFFESADGGKTWDELTQNLPLAESDRNEFREIIVDSAGAVYVLEQNIGVLVSLDGGANWDILGKPASVDYARFTTMTVLPGAQPVVFIGIEDEGAWRYSTQ